MTEPDHRWGGLAPSQPRKDLPAPPRWRMRDVAAVERPHHLRLSPDGSRIAFVLDRADLGSDLWVTDPGGTQAPIRVTVDRPPTAFWEDTAPSWSPDGSRLAYVADGWVRIVPADGGPSRRLVEADSAVFAGNRLIVGHEVLREAIGTELPTVTEVTRLSLVDLDDPWTRPVSAPGADAGDPDVSDRRAAWVVYPPDDRNRSDVVVMDLDGGTPQTVYGSPGVHAGAPRWSQDGSLLAFVTEEPGWYALHVWDGAGCRRMGDTEGDVGVPVWSPDDRHVATTLTHRGRSHLVVVDVRSGEVRVLAEGGTWSDPAWLDDGSIVAIHEDHATPARIERIGAHGVRHVVFDPAPAPVRAAPHVRVEDVTFTSHDGLEVHGFLLRPRDTPGPAPAVVYPHGGPTSHYGDEWDGYAQYFVDKGYAWFAVNFRGSTSYGRDFERANHGVWGVADTADCLAAADYLAGLDWVDGERIAIYGASYGSYMAVSALVSDPRHRFACGVAEYGDRDILTSWAQGDRVGVEDLERMMGHPSTARDSYLAGSPIHALDQMERPLLVAHGLQDRRVHPKQSEELVRQLERLGKTFEYVTYPTEGHGLLRLAPQLDFYRRLERFLDWYLM